MEFLNNEQPYGKESIVGNTLGQLCPKYKDYSCVLSPLDSSKISSKGGDVLYVQRSTINSSSTEGWI
jgi:hypothetical protein